MPDEWSCTKVGEDEQEEEASAMKGWTPGASGAGQ